MSEPPEPSWSDGVSWLLSVEAVPAALSVGRLMASAQDRWSSRLILRTSMHDALLTTPGAEYPFMDTVAVSCETGVYSFELRRNGLLVTADRSRQQNADAVLDAFAVQLAGGDLPTTGV